MAPSNRLRIIIDGGYLFNVFKPYRAIGLKYSQKRLGRLLAQNYALAGVHFVDSINDRKPAVKAAQERFYYGYLRDTLRWEVTILPLQWPGGQARQKGTDSVLTLLIYKLAVDNLCDTIVLVAADADFCQPVEQAVAQGKIVRNAYFAIRPSYHLQKACNGPAIRLDDLDFLFDPDDPMTLLTPRSVAHKLSATPVLGQSTFIHPPLAEDDGK
jgi:NYN domain